MPPDCYLEGVFAVDVVIRLDGCDDITGQRNAAEHGLLSAVYKEKKNRIKHQAEDREKKKQLPLMPPQLFTASTSGHSLKDSGGNRARHNSRVIPG